MCHFHSVYNNENVLNNGWSDIPVCRVHPPVPDYSAPGELGKFTYCPPIQVQNQTFQEKFSLTKKKVTKRPDKRQIDDYCPRAQLKKCLSTVER